MSDDANDTLGTYRNWASAFSDEELQRALKDVRIIRRGQLNDGDEYNRTTPAGIAPSRYDTLRTDRDDLDYREWNDDTGFSGVNRWPSGPGVQSAGQRRRLARKAEIDDGF